MKKKRKDPLPDNQQAEIVSLLNDFLKWIESKKIVKSAFDIKYVVDYPFANEDWVMKVNVENNTVSFNIQLLENCSMDYYKSILIHEIFHLAVQKVPNKEDAVRVKDDFGGELMKLIDIEADFYTALFFKEKLKYSLVRYLKLYYQGSKVFSDKRIRIAKFERFIGTLLSICKLFVVNKKQTQQVADCDLYLPSISPIYTESSMHVLVIKKEHIHFDEILASYSDFVELKACYTNVDSLSERGYIEKLIKFSCKALKLDIPKQVLTELNNL